MNLMKWYGITGGIASGKSTVSKKLRDHGLDVIDADQLARLVVAVGSPGLRSVVERFGADVLTFSGELDRKKLGAKVFGQPQQLIDLEGILHPLIQQETAKARAELSQKGVAFAFYDVPLLFEKKMQNQFDGVIVVATTEGEQIQRMKTRDGLSDAEIFQRLKAQIPLSEKIKEADFVIHNSGRPEDLDAQIEKLLQTLSQSGKA